MSEDQWSRSLRSANQTPGEVQQQVKKKTPIDCWSTPGRPKVGRPPPPQPPPRVRRPDPAPIPGILWSQYIVRQPRTIQAEDCDIKSGLSLFLIILKMYLYITLPTLITQTFIKLKNIVDLDLMKLYQKCYPDVARASARRSSLLGRPTITGGIDPTRVVPGGGNNAGMQYPASRGRFSRPTVNRSGSRNTPQSRGTPGPGRGMPQKPVGRIQAGLRAEQPRMFYKGARARRNAIIPDSATTSQVDSEKLQHSYRAPYVIVNIGPGAIKEDVPVTRNKGLQLLKKKVVALGKLIQETIGINVTGHPTDGSDHSDDSEASTTFEDHHQLKSEEGEVTGKMMLSQQEAK